MEIQVFMEFFYTITYSFDLYQLTMSEACGYMLGCNYSRVQQSRGPVVTADQETRRSGTGFG